ncbi:MAG: glycosyltransferase [Alphaproteobacteria bacterium]|nr:glycosyltransferase [Alphaproteobacteria bacterium]
MRILFLGGQDNLGYELCKWSRELGVAGEVYTFDLDLPRSQPELIDPEVAGRYPSWYHVRRGWPSPHMPILPATLKRRLAGTFDVAVVSGTRGLLASWTLAMPKVLYAIGGDVAEAPFPFAPRWKGVPAAIYRILRTPFARGAIRDIDTVIENFAINLAALDRLGLGDRRAMLGMPEDAAGNRRKVRADLLAELTRRYRTYRRVFLWLTRINYRDPTDSAYKGVDRFITALAAVRADLERGAIRLVLASHGDDVAALRRLVRREGLEPFIDWVPHLPYIDMLTYLALPNAVLFNEFGEDQTMPGALHRDAFTIGTVMVSSIDEDYAAAIYGARPPVLSAVRPDEIAARMRTLLDMDDGAFAAEQAAARAYGEQAVDYHHVIPRLWALLAEAPGRRAARLGSGRARVAHQRR